MRKLSPLQRKLVGIGAGLVTVMMLVVIYNFCFTNKFSPTASAYREVGSPKLDLADPTLTVFGKIQGPYILIKVLSPTELQIADTQAKTEVIKLIGLNDLAYPDPDPASARNGMPAPTPEPAAIKEARIKAIQQFKIDAIGKLLGTNQLWLVRASSQAPSPVYLFMPDAPLSINQTATGDANMVNALLLRKGLANLDVETAASLNQPFFDMMLESQLAAMIDAERKKTDGESLWVKFQMHMPAGTYENRLEEIKKRM